MSAQPPFQDFGSPDLLRHESEVGPGEIVALFDGASSYVAPADTGRVAVLGSDPILFPWLTVADNLVFGRERLTPFAQEGLVANALARVGLGDIGGCLPSSLSPAQRHGVALARLFLLRPSLLLLIRPFAGLHADEEAHLFDRLAALRREAGLRVLLAPRDLDQALLVADRILIARPGGPVVAGFVDLGRRGAGQACACRRLRSEIARAIARIPHIESAGLEAGDERTRSQDRRSLLATSWPP